VLQSDDISDLREAFDEFLSYYPFCYGYWKKYADALFKSGDIRAAKEVSIHPTSPLGCITSRVGRRVAAMRAGIDPSLL